VAFCIGLLSRKGKKSTRFRKVKVSNFSQTWHWTLQNMKFRHIGAEILVKHQKGGRQEGKTPNRGFKGMFT
jgi:hypothetical protein